MIAPPLLKNTNYNGKHFLIKYINNLMRKTVYQLIIYVCVSAKLRNSAKGQMILEALWLVLLSCAFLAMLSHLYEKGQKEIQLSRIGSKHTLTYKQTYFSQPIRKLKNK